MRDRRAVRAVFTVVMATVYRGDEGIAEGAGVDYASILALNVRTEIAYGMAKDVDGCTAFAWKTKEASFLAQNWDWRYEQRDNIIKIRIEQTGFPTIHMMSEGGIIGKIGLNSSSVGVTLNAISALGVDYNKLPVHLALRTVLPKLKPEGSSGEAKKGRSCCSLSHHRCRRRDRGDWA